MEVTDGGSRQVGRESHFLFAGFPEEDRTLAMQPLPLLFPISVGTADPTPAMVPQPWYLSQDLGHFRACQRHKPVLASQRIHPCLSNPEPSWTLL